MDFSTLLPKEHILLGTSCRTRQELFVALAAPLLADGIVTDGAAFVEALEARERQVTTRLEAGIALPHARSPVVKRMGLVVATAPEPGIPFADDGAACRLFFCIAVPAAAPTAHLKLLQALAEFARNPARVQRLLAATMPSRVHRALAAVHVS